MPLDDLLSAIEAEAREERERLEAESRTEAEAIVAAAHEAAARAREEILRAHAPATEGDTSRRVALARLEAARLLRATREEAFSELLDEVRADLVAARKTSGYRDALEALLAEALAALPDARTLRVHPDDEALALDLRRVPERELDVVLDPGVDGGVVLESAGGRRSVRNTFEERLSGAEPALRPWYGDRLEGLAGGPR